MYLSERYDFIRRVRACEDLADLKRVIVDILETLETKDDPHDE